MSRLKRAFILLSIIGLTFGYSLAAFTVMPQRAEAAQGDSTISPSALAPDGQVGAEADSTIDVSPAIDPACSSKPIATDAVVYDGVNFGQETAYFNTSSQIAGSWSGFKATGEGCEITNYKYRVRKLKTNGHLDGPIVSPSNGTEIAATPTSITITSDKFDIGKSLADGQKYVIGIKAKNKKGWSDWKYSSGQMLDITGPTAITDLSLSHSALSSPIVSLSWSAAGDTASGVSKYKVYRSISSTSSFEKIGETTGLTFQDNVWADNLPVYYKVIAIDNVGNTSMDFNIASTMVDDIAPGAPAISSFVGGGKITISWGVVPGATNYELYRNGVLKHAGAETTVADFNIVKGKTYSYVAYAIDEAGNKSLASNTLMIFVPNPTVSSAATAASSGTVQGATTTPGQQASPSVSPSPSPSGSVEASATSSPSSSTENKKTNWSLIIAIIIAAAIVVAGVLYWWYAREDEDEI